MATQAATTRTVRFGVFEFDPRAGELRKQGMKIKLQGQPIEILRLLLDQPGEVVTREELQRKLWPSDTFVDFEHSLNAAVKRLRDALDDSADTPRYVETLARRGYRFIAPADGLAPAAARSRTVRWIGLGAVAALVLLAALVGLNAGGWRDRIFRGGTKPISSIAVLPLANLSGDPEQDYFAEGMTEALITELGKISALRVISRQTMMQYKGTKKSAPQIAQELNVEAVVEGSVLRAGDHVRISVQLIEAVPERHLWANSYDRDLRDVLALHSEMARAVADEVRVKLMPQEQTLLASARPVNPEAYAAYLRGRYFWNRIGGPGNLEKALQSFHEAIEKDPSYASPHAGAAFCYARLGFSRSPRQVFPKARDAALKAMELDETLAEAHSALGEVKFNFDWDWPGAEREYKRALELNPNSVDAHWQYALFLVRIMGRLDEGIAEAQRALELDPLSPLTNVVLASNYLRSRRYDEAIAQYKRALELDPNNGAAQENVAWCYTLKGMYPEALAEYKKLGEFPYLEHARLVYLYAASGRRKEALKAIQELRRLSVRQYVDPFDMAIAYAGLGDKDSVFEWLRKAYDERSEEMTVLKAEPFFDPLRSDPRFRDLLRRMNFPSDPVKH